MKRVKIQILEERNSQTLPPAVELLAFDGCWGRESRVALGVGAPGRLPMPTYAYGKHKLDLVVNFVKRREVGREPRQKHSCSNTESNLRLRWDTHVPFWETSVQVSREPESVTSTARSYKRKQILFPQSSCLAAHTPPSHRWHVLCHSSCACAYIQTICSH